MSYGPMDKQTDKPLDGQSFLCSCMSATNKAGYTATKVACGWARASDEKANPSYWAGVVMQKPLLNAKKTDGDGSKRMPKTSLSLKRKILLK